MRNSAAAGVFLLSTALGCGAAPAAKEMVRAGGALKVAAPAGVAEAIGADCRRRHAGGAARLGAVRQSSTVALAKLGEATIAYVADEDARAVRTIDVDSRKTIAKTDLAGAPSQLMVLADGRVAVALRDKNAVEILEPAASAADPLAARCAVSVAAEPVALASTPDDKKLLVSSAWGRTLSVRDDATLAESFAVKLAREPRAVLVDDAGERAFIAHVVGATMSVVELRGDKHEARGIDLRANRVAGIGAKLTSIPEDKLRSGCQGFALAKSVAIDDGPNALGEKPLASGKATKPAPARPPIAPRIFAPMVSVEPGDPEVASSAYYGDAFDGLAKEAPIVSVVDAAAERTLTKSVMPLGARLARECMLPRAAAIRPSTGTLLVTCLGVDELLELDTRGLDPARLERHRWHVATGPVGVAVDDAHDRAVVWSQFAPAIDVVDFRAKNEAAAVKVAAVEVTAEPSFATGRVLFHLTDDNRIASDGSACASCHPEGREDAITWSTPDGPRQTIMLAGRVSGTAPFGWQGKHKDLSTYVINTFKRLGGSGFAEDNGEFKSLLAYVERLPAPVVGAPSDERNRALVARGKVIFDAPEQGCVGCHANGLADGAQHDVGSRAKADEEASFDTPSLHFVSGTAPYFHDGRYATLDDVLRGDNKMGHVDTIPRADREALKAYLESL